MTTSRQYDALNRLTQISSTPSGAGLLDGWNLVAETAPNNSLIRNYVWGTDLSGSAQGAGGVGGLLEVGYHGATLTNAFAAYDGNGNVIALVNAANGAVVASYEYGPFGEVIRQTGPMAQVNPIRFSAKYQDDESDLLYYGYRYYKASTGDWLNRDPLTEPGFYLLRNERQVSENSNLSDDEGGRANINDFPVAGGPIACAYADIVREEINVNPYGFVGNDPQDHYDLFGLTGRGVCRPNGHCGPDVTQALKAALIAMGTEWQTADQDTRAKVRHALFTQSGWDTILVTSKNLPSSCNQSCNRTVTVNDVCYLGPEVNYILFGYMCNRAGISEPTMVSAVIAQKLHKIGGGGRGRGGYDWQIRGAVSWAEAGYNGWPNSGAPYSDIGNCDPCSDVFSGFNFWWYVGPLHGASWRLP